MDGVLVDPAPFYRWLSPEELTGSVDGLTDIGVCGGAGGNGAGGVEDRCMVAAELACDVGE
jgi:hypothetical protein